MRRSNAVLLGLMMVVAIQPIWADSDRDARLEERLVEVRERLRLSDEQVEKVQPILQASTEAQRSVLTRYGIDLDAEGGPSKRLGMREARKLRSELGKVRTDTLEQLEDVLTDEQLEEFRKLQEEHRQAMQQRIRAGR